MSRSQGAVSQDDFDIVKLALSKMSNIREITTNLLGRKFVDDRDEWPETSIIRDPRNFYRSQLTDSHKYLQAKTFYELLAGLSQAQARLDTLTIYSF
ncbi:hypothetical protein RUND412_007803 [Rhizina undulata]